MSVTFIQASCREGTRADLRQSRVIAKYKPDIVLFESSAKSGSPDLIFNKYPPHKKPAREYAKLLRGLERASRVFPYARSDIATWSNINALWNSGKNVLTYNIDAPADLRREHFRKFGTVPYVRAVRRWQFWAYLYLREYYMSQNVKRVLASHRSEKNTTIAVFLQKVHWQHVQFLLKNPSSASVWKYYFSRFPSLTPATLLAGLKIESPIFFRYWKRVGIK